MPITTIAIYLDYVSVLYMIKISLQHHEKNKKLPLLLIISLYTKVTFSDKKLFSLGTLQSKQRQGWKAERRLPFLECLCIWQTVWGLADLSTCSFGTQQPWGSIWSQGSSGGREIWFYLHSIWSKNWIMEVITKSPANSTSNKINTKPLTEWILGSKLKNRDLRILECQIFVVERLTLTE